MQIHALVPHHHHEFLHPASAHEVSRVHSHNHHAEGSGLCEISSDHHHAYEHSHSDEIGTKPPRLQRVGFDFFAILPTALKVAVFVALQIPERICHPFIPFQTGPPSTISSRGPPVA